MSAQPQTEHFINPPTRAKAQGTAQRGGGEGGRAGGWEELAEMQSCAHHVAAALRNSQLVRLPVKT